MEAKYNNGIKMSKHLSLKGLRKSESIEQKRKNRKGKIEKDWDFSGEGP